jgi:hypothetical protein
MVGSSPLETPRRPQDKDASPMIRAVIHEGLIRPLDPLPVDWTEGRMVIVDDAECAPADDLDKWYEELRLLGSAQYDPGEREVIRTILAGADAQAKEHVRREMESP